MLTSPVRPVEFGTALSMSLNNYYDLLKTSVGGLGASEYLQLKLVCDTVDISYKDVSESGYRWFSYYSLLLRSDLEIEPNPLNGTVLTGAEQLSSVYGKFLRRLMKYAIVRDLTPDEQLKVADYIKEIESLQDDAYILITSDRVKWLKYAELMGINPGSKAQYIQWSNLYGKIRRIQEIQDNIKTAEFRKSSILNRRYQDPDDREIVDAVFDYENPLARLRYPIFADYEYDDGALFSATYLASITPGSTGIFDDRRAMNWNQTLQTIKTSVGGAFSATFDRSTGRSTSITTDWGGGASVSYGFINVSASASDHTSIQTDFRQATSLSLAAKSTIRANIIYPAWFKPNLFKHKHVSSNVLDFAEFFGKTGTLLYYPIAVVLIRGFSVEFNSSQRWSYDYERRFSASAGGGFSAFGVNFGGRGSYSKHEKTHEVDQSNTNLKIFDGDDTVRFIGYIVKKNSVLEESMDAHFSKANGQNPARVINRPKVPPKAAKRSAGDKGE